MCNYIKISSSELYIFYESTCNACLLNDKLDQVSLEGYYSEI